MTKPLKILITGVAGFLGSHLAEKLSNMKYKVVGIDNMIGGYKDNVPKNIEFHEIDCCDLKAVKNNNVFNTKPTSGVTVVSA